MFNSHYILPASKLLTNAGKFDATFGNNEWENGVLTAAGYKALEIPLLQRAEHQGLLVS